MVEQEGSSLPAVLVLITVLSMCISAVLVFYHAQYRLIRRDAHRLQAQYAAEAGVYVAMDSLQHNPLWEATDLPVRLSEGQRCRVSIAPFGGYLLIRSEARYRRSRAVVRAMVGEVPPPAFDNAIRLWDGTSGLQVAGHTRIKGDMVVGRQGVKTRAFKRRRFTGQVRGAVFRVPDLKPPYFDDRVLQNAIDRAERYLLDPPEALSFPTEERPLARWLPRDNRVHVAAGNWRITPADSAWFAHPATVVADGHLVLEGPLRFRSGTIFIAGKTLRVGPLVAGREGLFYGREGVEVAGTVHVSGQFLSQQHIRVEGGVYLRYPSLLYVSGRAALSAGIMVEDGAIVDGTIIHAQLEPEPQERRGRVVIQPLAQVRGAVFNAHETEMHGTLYGTLLTRAFYFYASPSSYVNWLKDAIVDVEARPVSYALPLRFSEHPELTVMNWEVFIDEPGRHAARAY